MTSAVALLVLLLGVAWRAAEPRSSDVLPSKSLPARQDTDQVPQRLQMPFHAGEVVRCSQGNYAAPGHTHSLRQNLHALDFTARVPGEIPIAAAAPGRVVRVVAGSTGRHDGAGYGNQVRVALGGTAFLMYAHLDRVSVQVGERVVTGQVLGTMGRTGLGGYRHLHFSLHEGSGETHGAPPTQPIASIVVMEMGESEEFRELSSEHFLCGESGQPWSGRLYGSGNRPQGASRAGNALLGPASGELLETLRPRHRALRKAINQRQEIWDYWTTTERGSWQDAERSLLPLLLKTPTEPTLLYAYAAEVDIPKGRLGEAVSRLEQAARQNAQPHLYEEWLEGWILVKRGLIALRQGDDCAARRHLDDALRVSSDDGVAAYAERLGRSLPHLDASKCQP